MATRAFELQRRRDADNSPAARAKELWILTIAAVTATSVPTNENSDQHATPVATPRPRATRRLADRSPANRRDTSENAPALRPIATCINLGASTTEATVAAVPAT